MCKCTPTMRTPFCGKPGCEWPAQKNPVLPVEPAYKCPYCGHKLHKDGDYLKCLGDRCIYRRTLLEMDLEAEVLQMRNALKTVLASALPNERDNPTMFAAWKAGQKAMEGLPPKAPVVGAWVKEAANAIWGGVVTEGLTEEEIEGIIRISIPAGWISVKKQKPPLCDETPQTNGFFLLLRHNPHQDAPGRYRMDLWFGSVPIDAVYWSRIHPLPKGPVPSEEGAS